MFHVHSVTNEQPKHEYADQKADVRDYHFKWNQLLYELF
jgi:hypothetical protein